VQPELDPDVGWVEALSGRSEAAATAAVHDARRERRLFAHLAREHAAEGRDSYVEIDAPLELHALVRLMRPAHVVEVGVSSGVSSAYLLSALERNGGGTLHSVDLPAMAKARSGSRRPPRSSWSLPSGRSTGWAVPFPLRKRWDLRLGDKADVLPLLAQELPRIDLMVYDVPHRDVGTRRELGILDPCLGPGSVVIVDHGPGGEVCDALRRWGRSRGSLPVRRAGLGLAGVRVTRRPPRSTRSRRVRAP
jgi:Methyltransferase domain